MIDFDSYADMFSGLSPYEGTPPKGFRVDFLGTLTDAEFRRIWGVDPQKEGGVPVKKRLPEITDGEAWFESANWIEAARAAKGRYTMITLGACYGAQAVGAAKTLMAVNPMPFKLVAVEAEPENVNWIRKHFADNGIDPDQQWILQAAMGASNAPVLFPVGSPGSGAQNGYSTNDPGSRKVYADLLVKEGKAPEALRSLLTENRTGYQMNLVQGYEMPAELVLVSSVTLRDVLAPFDLVDFLEADMQQSEIIVFPPEMALLKKKVRRVHIGTHGREVHQELKNLFERDGWRIQFDFRPNDEFETSRGSFTTNDGVLSAVNPDL